MIHLLRIAVVQEDCKLGNKGHNLECASALITQAAKEGARLVLFPEMFLTGYLLKRELLELAEEVSGPSINKLAKLAKTNKIHICMGFAERDPRIEAIFSSLVCISDQGQILAVYRKAHLFDVEREYFEPGDKAIVAETAIGRIGFSICYDFEFPEWPRINALQGAQLFLVSSANMEPWAEDQEIYAKARAMENQMFVALANRVGKDDRFLFCGNSIVIDPTGNTLKKADKDNSSLLIANIDFEQVKEVRNSSINYFRDRRYDIYGMIGEDYKTNND